MNVYILNSCIKKRDYDGIVLNESDFHPCRPFFLDHPQIKPEAVDKIYIRGILECHPYIRTILRYCDYMLAKEGLLNIEFFNKYFDSFGYAVRSRNEWQYELSLVFKNRILLIEQDKGLYSYFRYKKIERFLPENDTIDRWSFGIVSDGRKNERILQIIDRIQSFKILEYEILICGPAPAEVLPSHVRMLSDAELYIDLRIPISKKKNYIISEAQYNNLVVMHDRIIFSEDWYEKMKLYGNYWDCLSCCIINEDNHINRMADWGITSNKPSSLSLWNKIWPKTNILDYTEWSSDIYIAGGYFQIKKHLGIMLNPNLYWGEKEDADMSFRAYNDGVLFEFFADNVLYSKGVRFQGRTYNNGLIHKLRCVLGAYRRYKQDLKELAQYMEK